MESLLKTEKASVESLGREVELVELSYRAQMELMKAYQDGEAPLAGLIMTKHGVKEFQDETLDDLAGALPVEVVIELAALVSKFSGLDEDQEKK